MSVFCREKACPGGSMTVECALALPVYLFAVLTLLSFMYAVRLETDRTLSLSNRARKAAAASMGQEINLYIDMPEVVTYQFPFSALPVPDLKIAVRARVRAFTGYAPGSDPADEDGKSCYLTDNADVYHTHADCTHLSIAIYRTTMENVGSLRNEDGMRYKPCAGFPEGWNGPVYVTPQGEYYYPSTDYRSLTRHVHAVPAEDCRGLPLCERCAARDAADRAA